MNAPQTCREEVKEQHWGRCGKPAEFILWGRLFSADALGPRCYDHAVKHTDHAMPSRVDQYAIYDLRDQTASTEIEEVAVELERLNQIGNTPFEHLPQTDLDWFHMHPLRLAVRHPNGWDEAIPALVRWLRERQPRPTIVNYDGICPECRGGKHLNCTRSVPHPTRPDMVPCECPGREDGAHQISDGRGGTVPHP